MSHIIGFDDAPFVPHHRGNVLLVGAVFSGTRLEGVLSGKIRRDGSNATRTVEHLVTSSQFCSHVQMIMLQGVTFAGFNVVDVQRLHKTLRIPVLVVARKAPNMAAIKSALFKHIRGGRRKWDLIEALGPMIPVSGVFVQCVGLEPNKAKSIIDRFAINGALPEPLRTAHLIGRGVTASRTRQRA